MPFTTRSVSLNRGRGWKVAELLVTSELGTDAHSSVMDGADHISTNTNTETSMTTEETHTSSELVPTAAMTPAYYGEPIGARDLFLPKLFTAHSSSRVVQEDLVPFGALYVAMDANDPEPRVLYRPGAKNGVVIHALGKRDVWTYRDEDDRFRVVNVRDAVLPPTLDAVRGYDLAVLVPAYDLDLPCSWLLKSSAMSTGKRILTQVMRAAPAPSWDLAFSITTVQRQNAQGRWYVPQAVSVKAKPEHVHAAAKAAELLGVRAAGRTPEIA